MVNVAELLKNCPIGMELDCLLFETPVKYMELTKSGTYVISIKTSGGKDFYLTKEGYLYDMADSQCVIFPKGKTTWEGFVPPCKFKDVDILSYQCGVLHNRTIYIYRHNNVMNTSYYVALSGDIDSTFMINNKEEWTLNGYNDTARLATEEEKQKLFKAIKDNGYRWNAETKTLVKLFKPKFKVGDRVKSNYNNNQYDIIGLTDTHYTLEEVENKFKYVEPIIEDKNLELVPKKFDINTLKPLESKVLMRSSNAREWVGTIYSHYNNKKFYGCGRYCDQCIPYEGNEHLLGTTDDCDEYYKNW